MIYSTVQGWTVCEVCSLLMLHSTVRSHHIQRTVSHKIHEKTREGPLQKITLQYCVRHLLDRELFTVLYVEQWRFALVPLFYYCRFFLRFSPVLYTVYFIKYNFAWSCTREREGTVQYASNSVHDD